MILAYLLNVVDQAHELQVSVSDGILASTTNPGAPVAHLEQNSSVRCLRHVFSLLANGESNQHSCSGFFPHAQNTLITGGTFVRISRKLYK